jgi:hypothetical protein
MTQATDDILAGLAHVFKQLDRDAKQHEATIQAQHGKLEETRAALVSARAAADQAISNLRAIVALNDDPHIEEIANVTADLLGKVL